jgi:ADP-glucose pyrophosphorylase
MRGKNAKIVNSVWRKAAKSTATWKTADFQGVRVEEGAIVRDSVVRAECVIERGAEAITPSWAINRRRKTIEDRDAQEIGTM